ncbi:MAG: hypothetical protein ACU84Q_02175 [Gammaproteobacteria bacterium]
MENPLSDFELIEMFNEYLNATGFHFMNFITALFGFLLVVYLVGDKLPRALLIIVITLYTLFTIPPGGAILLDTLWFTEIANELQRRSVASSFEMAYPVALASGASGRAFIFFIHFVYWGSYFGSLLFLYEVRRKRTMRVSEITTSEAKQ